MKLHIIGMLAIAILSASCSPSSGSPDGPVTSGTPQPSLILATDPRPGDEDLVRAPAYVELPIFSSWRAILCNTA